MITIDTISTGFSDEPKKNEALSASKRRTLVNWLGNIAVKRRTRIHLSELTDAQLRDIGISPAQARREMRRFF
jgi:uncharacterized protein YjiS (DUF1127 family)